MKKLTAEIQSNGETLIAIDNVLGISFGALDRGDLTDITNWGVFSNKGELSFIDTTKNFKSIISSYYNPNVCIYYITNSTKKLLATFLIDDYDYNDESKKVTLTLKDSLIDWQQNNIDEYYTFVKKSISDIWGDIYGAGARATTEALNDMSASMINTSYLNKATKWSNADKICQATMLRCFCDFDGTPMFSDETPRQLNNIVIKPRNIFSIGNKVGNVKTKIQLPSISAQNITKHENEPISDDIPFTLYDVKGKKSVTVDGETKLYIEASWAYDFANVTTLKIVLSGATSVGASVSTSVQKPQHFFNYGDVDITVNQAIIYNNYGDIQIRTMSSNPNKQVLSYSPSITVKEYDRYLGVSFQDDEVAEKYSQELEALGVVGSYCITKGTINVIGNFFTEDGETSYGSQSEKATNLQSNEIIQTQSTYGEKNLAQHIIDTVTEKYGNGVECVEMEVTPSEYYDIDGNNIISPNGYKPLFEKYDIVTPYIIKNGIEQPYSTKYDGSAKSFKVIGIEYSYQGLLRQKLYLQETTN